MSGAAGGATGEMLAGEYEALVLQVATIADALDELGHAADTFEAMIRATLAETDHAVATTLTEASSHATDLNQEVQTLAAALRQIAQTAEAEIRQAAETASQTIGSAIDTAGQAAEQHVTEAEGAVRDLDAGIQQVLQELTGIAAELDAAWLATQAAGSQFHLDARQRSEQFAQMIRQVSAHAAQAGGDFANQIAEQLLPLASEMASSFDKILDDLGSDAIGHGLTALREHGDQVIREEIAQLFEQAIEAVKTLIENKIDELIGRRDNNSPLRQALEGIFDALGRHQDSLEDKVGKVDFIRGQV